METDQAIRNGLALLSASMRQEVDAMQVRAYRHTLKAIAGDVIYEAAERLASEPGRRFFPTTGEWTGVCATVIDERRAKASRLAQELQENCAACLGSGWRNVVVAGVERVDRCRCWTHGLQLVANCGQSLRQLTSGDEPPEAA